MKNHNTLWLLLLALCSVFASCKKDTPKSTQEQLPPETHTGAFTFGCKVDGKIYTASGKESLLATQFVSYGYYIDSSIAISVGNTNQLFNFHAVIKYSGNTGIHYAKTYPYIATFYDNANGTIPGNSNTYDTDSVNIGKINIKYFSTSVGGILSGTFEMDAKNINGKVIRITEGRFDIGQ